MRPLDGPSRTTYADAMKENHQCIFSGPFRAQTLFGGDILVRESERGSAPSGPDREAGLR